jgi:hypothetical protein
MIFRLLVTTVLAGLGFGISAGAQDPASGAAPAPVTTKEVLQPAVMSLQQAIGALRVEKWKASKEVKAATTDKIGSIRRDVEGTLPGLVTAADAAPGSLAAMLPVSRNVGALYDVVLRVTVIAESAAPGDQADALAKSLSGMESARRTLADRLQQLAAAEEAQVEDLRKQLNARPAVAAVCPPVASGAAAKTAPAAGAKRRKKAVKPAAKPAGSPVPAA